MTVGALSPGLVVSLAQSFNTLLAHTGGPQCPLVCLLGFLEGLTWGATPLLGPGSKTQSVDWATGQMMWPPSGLMGSFLHSKQLLKE